MKTSRFGLLTLGVITGMVSTGCSQAKSVRFAAPTIPVGTWQGRGAYVAYEGVGATEDDPAPKQRFQDGVYETSLDISSQTLFGRQAIVIEIRSKRGKIMDSDDTESHLRVLLLRLEPMTHGSTPYAIGMLEYNFKEPADYQKQEAQIRAKSNLPSASCVRIGADTCLQIQYLVPEGNNRWTFKDTFVFSGGDVIKTGNFVGTSIETKKDAKPEHKVTQIYWVERLGKTKQLRH